MYYSVIGLLALTVLIITNHDVLLQKPDGSASPVQRIYRRFLFCIMAYYITDILWGVLDSLSLTTLLYADTVVYYLAMAAGILLWTQYAIAYLEQRNRFRKALSSAGKLFFAVVCAMTVINLFTPIMFYFDENGVYQAGPVRHALLIVQILLFLFTSLYVLHCAAETRDSEESRHLTIGLFGLIMVILLSIQLFYPFLPLYTIGYMLGGCLLRTFVIENEREEYRRDLEASLHREEEARRDLEASIAREKEQFQQLTTAWKQAYTDVLTGVKSKLAYSDKVQQLDKALENGVLDKLAIVVFDLNDLKRINDTLGHDVGDEMIISACRLICKVFDHSPVYRIGGDEFAAILEGSDYENREELLRVFDQRIEENSRENRVVVSAGMAEYLPGSDSSADSVFRRADAEMYRRKEQWKQLSV